jgi:hypothetical protein
LFYQNLNEKGLFLMSNVLCIVVTTFTKSTKRQLLEWFFTKRFGTIKKHPSKMIHLILFCSFLQLSFWEMAI